MLGVLSTLVIGACSQSPENAFELNIQMEGLEEGEKVYLYKPDPQGPGRPRPVDSAVYSGGAAAFEGALTEAYPYFIAFEKHQGAAEVFLEPSVITVKGQVSEPNAVEVQGSEAHQIYRKAVDGLMEIDQKGFALNERYGAARKAGDQEEIAKLESEFNDLLKEREAFVVEFAGSHPESPVGPYLINSAIRDLNYTEVQPVFESFSPEVRQSPFGKALEERLTLAKKTAEGVQAPSFTASTPEGEELSLENALGKVTVIDFWASWCAPCRQENPKVVKMYERLHDKGLEIVGVSLDEDAAAWKKAIEEDGLTWKQVSDLKGFESEIAMQYGVMAIPQTFILDEEGKIAAKGLRGKELEDKVVELVNQ